MDRLSDLFNFNQAAIHRHQMNWLLELMQARNLTASTLVSSLFYNLG